jgi:integration host factor subunit alpha
MTLKKADIVEAVAKQNGYTLNQSFEVVESLLEIIKSALESGEDVLISGFGKFCVKERKARRWRMNLTSEYKILPPKKVVAFKCSGKLRDMISG